MFKEEWDKYILPLKHIGLRREQKGDKLTSNGTKMENKIKSREAYQSLTEKRLHSRIVGLSNSGKLRYR